MDFTKEQLRLAFAHHVAQKVIGVDEDLDPFEIEELRRALPREAMVAAGLVDGATGHFAARFEDAVQRSFTELPGLLDDHDRIELLALFDRLACADGEFLGSEAAVIEKALSVLGWTREEARARVAALHQARS